MTIVTATEFKQNLGQYLTQTATEDIFITKNNKVIAKITTPTTRPTASISQFFNALPSSNFTAKAARIERALRKR